MNHQRVLSAMVLTLGFFFSSAVFALEPAANVESEALAKYLMRANDQMVSVQWEAQTIAEASNAMAKQNSKLTRGYSMKVFNRELPKLTETMARLYADNFSVEEMKSLIDFYTSPKGRLMIDFSRAMSGGTPSKADFNEADGKAGMQAGVEFQASTLGKLYAERLQKIQAQAGEIIETVHKKARAAGADR